MTNSYFRGAQGVILIFDVCDKESFTNLENWSRQIKENSPKDIKKVLVGTNIDDESKR